MRCEKSRGQFSSCLTFAKVEYGWIKDVEAINAGLHGIDITSPTYDHLPDTDWTKDGSRYIWIDNCVTYGSETTALPPIIANTSLFQTAIQEIRGEQNLLKVFQTPTE